MFVDRIDDCVPIAGMSTALLTGLQNGAGLCFVALGASGLSGEILHQEIVTDHGRERRRVVENKLRHLNAAGRA